MGQGRRGRVQALVGDIERETSERIQREGRPVMGARRIMGQTPTARPELSKRSPAPHCHASSRKRKRNYLRLYRKFVDLYREAKDHLRNGKWPVHFPEHCFPPSLPYTGTNLATAPT